MIEGARLGSRIRRGASAPFLAAQPYDPASALGPAAGGWPVRFAAAACSPSPACRDSPTSFYFGAVGGGVWESHNAGRTWEPIFDCAADRLDRRDRRRAVGPARALRRDRARPTCARTSPTATACTGPTTAGRRGRTSGSTRRARSAASSSIRATRTACSSPRSVTPTARTRSAASSARSTAASTWTRVLFKDDDTGAIDLAIDPSNAQTISRRALADAASAVERLSAVERSRQRPLPLGRRRRHVDAGRRAGFPSERLGRIGVAFAPSDPRRVYAIVDAKEGGLYASDDGGVDAGSARARDPRIWERGWYFGGVTVDPKNAERGLRVRHRDVPVDRRRQDVPARQGRAGRRRLPRALDRPGRPAADDPRQRSGRGRHGRRRPDVELLVQPADRAVLPRRRPTTGSPTGSTARSRTAAPRRSPSRTDYRSITLRDWRPIAVGGENGYIAPDPRTPTIVCGRRPSAIRLDARCRSRTSIRRSPIRATTAASGRCR